LVQKFHLVIGTGIKLKSSREIIDYEGYPNAVYLPDYRNFVAATLNEKTADVLSFRVHHDALKERRLRARGRLRCRLLSNGGR
jgi:hypothetical protein